MDYEGTIDRDKFRCQMCQYTSDRQYNVTRHEGRIHSRKLKRRCCGKLFFTKGEWYLHCEEFHPSFRASSLISREKYKILKPSEETLASAIGDKRIGQRRSARIRESIKKERSMTSIQVTSAVDELDMEDVPLINFIQHRELYQKFIDKSCNTHNGNLHSILSMENESSDVCDGCSENSSSVTTTEEENDASEQIFYRREIVAIATETVQYTNRSDGSNICDDYIKNITTNNESMNNLAHKSSMEFFNQSKTIGMPLNLPLKKRILQELRIDSIGISRHRKLDVKSKGDHKNFDWSNKENIKPIAKNIAGETNVSEKVIVTRAEESVTWNEITKHQRAYLSSVDWDRYKIF